jgi:hypothetical protein
MEDDLTARESDIFEHKKVRVTLDDETTVSRLFHLGTMKNCPLCKRVQEKVLSQIREFRFRYQNREVLQIVASQLSAVDENREAVWDVLIYSKVDGLSKEFVESAEKLVQSDIGGGTVVTGTDAEIQRVIDEHKKPDS